jgi:brefeldin A-inhibited guanine nucleotide-exchange protein
MAAELEHGEAKPAPTSTSPADEAKPASTEATIELAPPLDAVVEAIPEGGKTNGLAHSDDSAQKELPRAPETENREVLPTDEQVDPTSSTPTVESTPPPPPPKPTASTTNGTHGANGINGADVQPPHRPQATRMDTGASMQDVELSRSGTPRAEEPSAPEIPAKEDPRPRVVSNPASTSVTSLHSVTSSVQSPSRPTSAQPRGPSLGHSRRSSAATTLSLSSGLPGGVTGSPQLSTVLIMPPLQVLVQSKEARKSASFHAAAQRALDLCQAGEGASNAAYLHPREIFEPLRLAISNPQTTSVPILITSLDLLSKLISHSFFAEPNGPPKGLSPLPDLITHTITLAYSESSPPQVALQVVKALMATVLSTDKGMLVHQSSLLKAIRTVYNVFLLSNDAANQVVAQGGLTQMVHHVFGRVVRPDPKSAGFARRSTLGESEARRLESREGTPAPRENGSQADTQAGDGGAETPKEEKDGQPKMTL